MNSIHSCALPDKEKLNSASSHTSSCKVLPPPVTLVGTHIDQIPQNLPTMVDNYGGQIVMPGLSGSSNPGPRSPVQDDVQTQRGHDPDAPITIEHMNHPRLCVALITVCGNALRDILLTNFPVPYEDIYQVILANKVNLTKGQERPLLNPDQSQLVFPDPLGQTTGTVDQFDLSLLYTLIRNINTVPAPVTGWGHDPQDQPRDKCLGASVERICYYRNHISGHSSDGKISQQDLEDYWSKFYTVLPDIEALMGGKVVSQPTVREAKEAGHLHL